MRRGFIPTCHPRVGGDPLANNILSKRIDSRLRGSDAFTLIELSIVLVIIGLIAGGVLIGQDLIRAASIRQDISAINSYTMAFKTFEFQYDCVAGDCETASQLGLGTFNGDGNGRIDLHSTATELQMTCANYPTNTGTETGSANNQLALAGLLNQPSYSNDYANCAPGKMTLKMNFGSGICAVTIKGRNMFRTCRSDGLGDFAFTAFAPKLTPAIAFAMDTKVDDGKPRSGNVLGGIYNLDPVHTYWYDGCTTNASGSHEYLASSESMDTNSTGVEYGCPMVYFDAF